VSTERDLPRIVQAWLHEDAHEYGDHVLDKVVDLLDSTPQRSPSWLARTFQVMNASFVRYGLAAAAVVVIAIIGSQLIGGSNVGGPGSSPSVAPSETGEPSPSAPVSAEPSIPADGSLPAGSTFVLWNAPGDVAITIKIPDPGWFGEEGGGMLVNGPNFNPPDSVALKVFQLPLYVYGDPCHWSTTTPAAPVTTAAEFTAALEAQTSGDATSQNRAWGITDGLGWEVLLHVPGEAVVAACDGGQFRSWTSDPQQDPDARFHQGPGQIHDLWVGEAQLCCDWGGAVVVFDVVRYPANPDASVDSSAIANVLWDEILSPTATFEKP